MFFDNITFMQGSSFRPAAGSVVLHPGISLFLRRGRIGALAPDGPTAPARCRILEADEAYDVTLGHLRHNETAVEITITEGRKREVKRMFGAIRHPVLELNRVSFGPITARGLALGSWRMLTTDEVGALRKLAAKTKDR